jgi:hypothetical protein
VLYGVEFALCSEINTKRINELWVKFQTDARNQYTLKGEGSLIIPLFDAIFIEPMMASLNKA